MSQRERMVAAAVDREQHVVLPPHRLNLGEFDLWIARHLQPGDAVVLEATSNAWQLYDQSIRFAPLVRVANPGLVKLIATARVKTDGRDALHWARLLAPGLLPWVWVHHPSQSDSYAA